MLPIIAHLTAVTVCMICWESTASKHVFLNKYANFASWERIQHDPCLAYGATSLVKITSSRCTGLIAKRSFISSIVDIIHIPYIHIFALPASVAYHGATA